MSAHTISTRNVTLREDGISKLKLSASSLDTFNSCPRRWAWQYVEENRDAAGIDAELGTLGHSVLEDLFESSPEDRTLEAARENLRERWPNFLDLETVKASSMPEIEMKRQVWAGVAGIWDIEDPSRIEVVGNEEEFDIELQEGSRFRGFVDRQHLNGDKGLVIVDYKLGKVPAISYTDSKIHQIQYYALVKAELGETPTHAFLYYTRFGTTIGVKIDATVIKKTKERYKRAANRIHKAVESGEYKAKTSPLCAWCPAVLECEEGQRKVRELHQFGRVREDAPALDALGLSKHTYPSF